MDDYDGYGGYKYIDDRWKKVARPLTDIYDLKPDARILDVGCGKAFLLHELRQLLPDAEIVGFDISRHGLADAKEEVRDNLFHYRAQDVYPWGDELETAVREIERVGKNKYVMLESYRNEQELFNLQCWALTCESFFDAAEWIWIYKHFGYSGDYEFIYFE